MGSTATGMGEPEVGKVLSEYVSSLSEGMKKECMIKKSWGKFSHCDEMLGV